MSSAVDTVLALLREQASADRWAQVLSADVEFEALRANLSGREAVAAQMGAGNFAGLDWARLDHPGVVLMGAPVGGKRERGLAITLQERDGAIVRISQQGVVVPAAKSGAPLSMDAAMRERIDRALEREYAISICYVDQKGAPHLSFRGSILTFGPDRLAMWARAGSGMIAALPHNPNVALMMRDPSVKSLYQITGRARIVEDEATRKEIFSLLPEIERRHDFALLGAAIIIDLDLIEGYAGWSTAGQVEPVRMVRE